MHCPVETDNSDSAKADQASQAAANCSHYTLLGINCTRENVGLKWFQQTPIYTHLYADHPGK
eukprot:scaffold230692_cov15-Prasinocladus_malaysianus.AAC.1